MRRLASWLVLAGVAAVVAVALADALRSSPVQREATTPASPAGSAELLRAAGIRGGILTIAGEDCLTRQIAIPSFSSVLARRPRITCGGRVWDAAGDLSARCRDNRIRLAGGEGEWRGCAPAWRPSGFLTFVRDGALLEAGPLDGCPGPCEQVWLSREELAQELAGRVDEPESYRVAEVAWMTSARYAAILEGREPWQQLVAVFRGPRLETLVPQFGSRIGSLAASARGKVAFARATLSHTVAVLGPNGRELPTPRIANVRSFTWSPSERYVALATRNATFIARSGSRKVIARLDFGARAIDWR